MASSPRTVSPSGDDDTPLWTASKEAVLSDRASVADAAALVFAFECLAEICLRKLFPELLSAPLGVEMDRSAWILRILVRHGVMPFFREGDGSDSGV